MVTFIDEWRRKFPSCMVVKRLKAIATVLFCNSKYVSCVDLCILVKVILCLNKLRNHGNGTKIKRIDLPPYHNYNQLSDNFNNVEQIISYHVTNGSTGNVTYWVLIECYITFRFDWRLCITFTLMQFVTWDWVTYGWRSLVFPRHDLAEPTAAWVFHTRLYL